MLRSYTAREVCIGSIRMGGNNPVVIQSMTNTDTLDVRATVEQVKRLKEAGCELVRITTPTLEHVKALERIKNTLYKEECILPLVADVHFLPKVAIEAAQLVEKVRINPGNYTDKHIGKVNYTEEEHKAAQERTLERMHPLLQVCKANNTVLRLGVNQGSISERMLAAYGHTPEALVASALEFVEICEMQEFYDLVISVKSSSVKQMCKAVFMLADNMKNRLNSYPLHLGVTEAGNGLDGRLISAVGIGRLLKAGIGDTIRVSLTEEPEAEVPVAKSILYWAENLHWAENTPPTRLVSDDISDRVSIDRVSIDRVSTTGVSPNRVSSNSISPEYNKVISLKNVPEKDYEIATAVALSDRMMDGEDGFVLEDCKWDKESAQKLLKDLYQAAEAKFYKTRFIACPSCGRTLYNIQQVLETVKERFSGYSGLTIAVMGCVVNGPGEMADADYGYIGSGNGLVNLYKKGSLVNRHLPEKEALDALENLIKKDLGL